MASADGVGGLNAGFVPTAPHVPARFRMARELRGYTQRDLVERMEVSISTAALSQIESGKVRPSAETVRKIAAAAEVPVGFLMSQRPGDAHSAVTYFRDLRATTVRERRRATAHAALLGDLLFELEQVVRLPEPEVPSISIGRDASRQDLEAVASDIRQAWQLGDGPIPHVVRELERHGIAVARLTLGTQRVDAFSTRMGRRPLVLLATDKSNYVRSRFDAAHELAHLVMHGDAEPGSKAVEGQAHDFASSFLMPEEAAVAELPRRLDPSGWSQLAEVKRRWGLSMAALLYRARSLRLVSVDDYRGAIKYMSSRGWRAIEPGDREMGSPEAPLLIERSIRRAEIEAGVSLPELVRRADLPVEDVKLLIDATNDPRPTVEL